MGFPEAGWEKSFKPHQSEWAFSNALPLAPPWTQAFVHTWSSRRSRPPRCPVPYSPSCWEGRRRGRGREKNHYWPLPVYRPAWSRPPVSQDAARDRDAEAESRPNGLLLFSTPFIGLSLSSKRHVDHLSLGLGPSKTGGQTILSTEPLRFLHPSSAACSPGGTQNTRPTACANKHVHVPRRLLHGLLYESPALRLPPLAGRAPLLKDTRDKRFYHLDVSFQTRLEYHSLYKAHQSSLPPHNIPPLVA